MKSWQWDGLPPQRRRLPSLHLATWLGLLLTSVLLFQPAVAHASPTTARTSHTSIVPLQALDTPTPRLETFEVSGGAISHKWSDDNGANWTSWFGLDSLTNGLPFVGTPAVVSDGVGRLTVFARDSSFSLWYNTYTNTLDGPGSGWRVVPGTSGIHVIIGGENYGMISDPTVSSWGPGRMDLFVYGQSFSTGVRALLHTWADNRTWSGIWEVRGTGDLQSNPAAVSTTSGSISVFARRNAAATDDLESTGFSQGQWSGGWHDEERSLTLSPAATSLGAFHVLVVVRNLSGGLSLLERDDTGEGWTTIDTNAISSAPAAASTPEFVHVFALGTNGSLLYRKRPSSDRGNLHWSGWVDLNGGSSLTNAPAAGTWLHPSVVVPNVLSLDQTSATSAITGAGLVLGSVTQDNTCTAFAGTVLLQDPVGGALVFPGSSVSIRVSSGVDSKGHPCIIK